MMSKAKYGRTDEHDRRVTARIGLKLLTQGTADNAFRKRQYFNLPWANVGRAHPDYGMTQSEHFVAKAKRQESK